MKKVGSHFVFDTETNKITKVKEIMSFSGDKYAYLLKSSEGYVPISEDKFFEMCDAFEEYLSGLEL